MRSDLILQLGLELWVNQNLKRVGYIPLSLLVWVVTVFSTMVILLRRKLQCNPEHGHFSGIHGTGWSCDCFFLWVT